MKVMIKIVTWVNLYGKQRQTEEDILVEVKKLQL